ncbi:unnamed protein product, partial [Prorocentrum cordatum]
DRPPAPDPSSSTARGHPAPGPPAGAWQSKRPLRTDSTSTAARWECASSRGSAGSATGHVARGMMVLQTAGIVMVAVPPAKLDRERLAAFRDALRAKGIDTSRWGVSGAKTVEHLFWEAYQQEGCIITGVTEPGAMKRVTRLVKIRLVAEIFGVDHTLFSRLQFMHDGQTNERRQVPLKKLTWHGMRDKVPDNDLVYSENCPYTEDWRTGVTRALDERLGLTEKWQQQHLEEDASAYSYHTEDNVQSDGYPGLNTLYCIHDVTFRIVQPEHAGVQCIGLPHGQEFATAEGDFNFSMQIQEDGLAIGTQLNIWTWARNATSTPVPSARREPSPAKPGGRSDSVDSGGDARVLIPSSGSRCRPSARRP